HFKEWRVAPHSFLWLHGIPGAGKTILCSTIIEELSLHCRSDPSLAIAFFYFDFNNKDTLPNVVLRSLIKQLSVRANSFQVLASLFARDEPRALGQEELMNTLKSIVKGYQTVYIVFDALDECPERSRFLEAIEEINDWKLDTLHLMATSRKERDIEETLGGLISHAVYMHESLVDGDIRVHVSRTLDDDRRFRMCSAEEKEMVKTTLINGAHGMFRWVVCQLDALWKCRTPVALEKALTRLPKTLYETYDRILEAIDEDDRRDALRLLQWLAFSFGPLSTDQAVEVIATDPDAEDGPLFDRRRRLRDPRDILTICLSLVTITFQVNSNSVGNNSEDNYDSYGEDNYEGSSDGGSIDYHVDNRALLTEAGEITLAHFSVREYLISEHLRTSAASLSHFHFNEKIADVFIAKTCLAYLLQFEQDNSVWWTTFRCYPLSRYAANNWMGHAKSDSAGDLDDLHEMIMALLEPTSAVYVNWTWLYNHSHRWSMPENPLYIAADTGLERVCQHLLQKGYDVNAHGGYCGTALQVAALMGHDTIVRLFLEKCADGNAHGGEYGSALQMSASQGDDTTVQLLIEKGGNVNAQGVRSMHSSYVLITQ
ncbi:hypothetical protein JB92DRAFT_3198641, partial [Gautieria morchelliformis]